MVRESDGGLAENEDIVAGPESEAHQPTLVVHAAKQYLLGFPMVISVVFENHSSQESYRPPSLWLEGDHNPLGVRLEPIRGGAPYHAPARAPDPEAGDPTFHLAPRRARQMTYDLTSENFAFKPGVYRLTLSVLVERRVNTSAPVIVELVQPSSSDAAEARRLLHLDPSRAAGSPMWKSFVDDPGPVSPSPALSMEARSQLALHLFLKRAVTGPEDLAHVDPSLLDAVTEPSLQAEVFALRFELAVARRSRETIWLRKQLLSRWKGMGHRIDQIEQGLGTLFELRDGFQRRQRRRAAADTRSGSP